MKRPHLAVGWVTLAFAAFFGGGLPFLDSEAGYAGLSPRTVPVIVTVGLAVCGLLLLLRPASIPASAASEGMAQTVRPSRRRALAWVVGGLLADMVLISATSDSCSRAPCSWCAWRAATAAAARCAMRSCRSC